jgi:(p)ppGpp synthase/HD superfamily hydrolase
VYIAALAFEDRRRDGSDELYLTHALDVAQALGPEATTLELTTAALHDVLEDTDWTKDDLTEAGVEDFVLEAVEMLTRKPEERDDEFVVRISTFRGDVGAIARRVKWADLTVNLANADSEAKRSHYEWAIPVVRSAIERDMRA